MKLLLIEDEPNVVSIIQRGLSVSGYEISVAMDGKLGLEMALGFDFDVVILDLMLPKMNGMEVCRNFRKQNTHTPILMLTALSTTENIVTGLDSGADDYLTKPFKLAELEARIRTITRRSKDKSTEDTKLRVANLELDRNSKSVKRDEVTLNLTATEFRLLEFLLVNQSKVLTRLEILENVWDINFNLGTNVVDVYINYLRKKVDNDFMPKLIHTVYGMGYVLRQ
ncbi:response regulator transcription factor [Rhabdobacter roseus]|uniref:DNA-binding response OmpR family regulator n=1 Tax=Rhabdobacter roseus TaxID=1655419 RepID=A0A840THI6_9BACT|nr:response regulator transcription factor [Rhabdobacter roseus]MBB5283616.1 DNA-binding response OmpR family regulator [Rhabdobacter roseus]